MVQIFSPNTPEGVSEVVRAGGPLEIVSGGTRRGYGRFVEAETLLDVSRLAGIVDYDHTEMVLTARPGTRLRDIAVLLAARGQCFAFEPPDLGPLWGAPKEAGSLGGALATGCAGARRPLSGSARDHILGFKAVNGLGEIFSGGGKVIKNVTGYDLPKLMAGSMGTLCVLTEVTVKVLPAPRGSLTLALEGLDTDHAILAMKMAMNSAMVVSGAAHLPREVLQDLALAVPRNRAWTLLRLEGLPVSLAERAQRLTDLLAPVGSFAPAAFDCSPVWKAIDDVYPFTQKAIVWRVSLPPGMASAFLATLPPDLEARWYLNWGGGLIWLFLDAAPDGHAASVRNALDRAAGREGHATLMRAPEAVRRHVSVFQPLAPEVAALSRRIKSGFDPDRVLNPGRLYADI